MLFNSTYVRISFLFFMDFSQKIMIRYSKLLCQSIKKIPVHSFLLFAMKVLDKDFLIDKKPLFTS